MKVCNTCNNLKSLKEFYYHKCNTDKLTKKCKSCLSQYYKDRNKDPKIKNRKNNYELKKYYNITLDQYREMLINQKNCCKICDRHESLFKYELAVDHCHKTSKIRGLLCQPCNTAIGLFKDNVNIINKAMRYLNENS